MKKLLLGLLLAGCNPEHVIDESPGYGGVIRKDGHAPTIEYAKEIRAYRQIINLTNCGCGFEKLCTQSLLTRESADAFRYCIASAVWNSLEEPEDQARVLKCYQKSFKAWVRCLGQIEECSRDDAQSIATACYNERKNWVSTCGIEDIWSWDHDLNFEETVLDLAID